jgi:hypothetical protein
VCVCGAAVGRADEDRRVSSRIPTRTRRERGGLRKRVAGGVGVVERHTNVRFPNVGAKIGLWHGENHEALGLTESVCLVRTFVRRIGLGNLGLKELEESLERRSNERSS